MSSEEALRLLLQHPRIWRAGSASQPGHPVVATGFSVLDQRLGGGWPVGVLTELLQDGPGCGELRLLMPALLQLCSQDAVSATGFMSPLLCWVAPPAVPYAPALAQQGMDLSRMLVVRTRKPLDTLWAAEQALRSASCAAVLVWLPAGNGRLLRRLQLAAEVGLSWCVLLRPVAALHDPSPALLRIQLETVADKLQLNFIRNRYGSSASLQLSC